MVAILDHMSALADPTRCRILLLLEKHELTVSELCVVLQTPQSSVSRHLKTLADDDWVSSRRDGTSRFYSMPLDDLDSGATRLWPLIREQVAATAAAGQDGRRLQGVLARRRTKSQATGIVSAAICSGTPFTSGPCSASSTRRSWWATSDVERGS
jgi:ArsR family transcriptional regulator